MKFLNPIPLLTVLLTLAAVRNGYSQQNQREPYSLSLKQAISLARENNKTVQISAMEETAAMDDYHDAKNAVLPTLGAGAAYQRYSKVTLYEHGLNDATQVSRQPGPDGGNLGVDAAFTVYSGGRIKALIEESSQRHTLAQVNSKDQAGSVSLQAAVQYLDLVRLYHYKNLLQDQLKRAETRLKNITSFYKNQRVTRSDLLRAELAVSNVLLSKTQNENDIVIAGRKLGVLLELPPDVSLHPSDSLLDAHLREAGPGAFNGTAEASYRVQKADISLKIQSARISSLKSNYYPSLTAFSAYGFNYPNYLFFKPIDQAYSVGYVGLRLNYTISSLYHNTHKVRAAKQRFEAMELQKGYVTDNVKEEIEALNIKYAEALNRVEVTAKSIEQSRVNFEIINTKYLNQLSLLTDLLDADNLYQESRYTNINAQIGALIIHYRLRYATGNL